MKISKIRQRQLLIQWNIKAIASSIIAERASIFKIQTSKDIKAIIRNILYLTKKDNLLLLNGSNINRLERLSKKLSFWNTRRLVPAYLNKENLLMNIFTERFFMEEAKPLLENLEKIRDKGIFIVNSDSLDNLVDLISLRDEKKNKVKYPKSIFIECTRNCNGLCSMCSRKDKIYEKRFDMPIKTFQKIVKEYVPKADYIDLRGFGESSMLPDFKKRVAYALRYKKKKAKMGIITNFTHINDPLWKYIIEKGLWLGISADGSDKSTYERIRSGSDFKDFEHNLNLLKKITLKNKKLLKNIYFLITVQGRNMDNLPKIIKLASDLGIKKIELYPVGTEKKDKNNLKYHKRRLLLRLKEAKKIADDNKIKLMDMGLPLKKKKTKKTICKKPSEYAYFTYDGKVGPCNHLISLPFTLGDIKEGDFNKITNNYGFRLFKKLLGTKNMMARCAQCHRLRNGF